MDNAIPLRYIVYRYSHHSPHSGYSRLPEYGMKQYPAEVISVGQELPRWLLRNRIFWWLAKGTPGYTRAAISAELMVAKRMLREHGSIFHFLYGETTYHYTGQMNKRNGNRLVATFHLPPDGIRYTWQIEKPLQQLSAAVCVGTSQMDYMSHIVGSEKVFFSPLGVDIEYYTPPTTFSSRDPDLCILVGDNYRDFPTFRGVIELVAYMRPQTRFVAVIPPRCNELVGDHPNLTFQSKIPEARLLELYRSASLMILPLKDATANNALLESLACGVPNVITDIGSTRDYTGTECAALIPPNDARKMADTVVELLRSPGDLERMSEASVKQASKFAWPKVIKELSTIYATIN